MMAIKRISIADKPDHQAADGAISGRPSDRLAETWETLSRSIARRVKHTLIERNLSQKELSRLIGFQPQQMSRILSGKANLTIKTVAKMELALGVRLLHVVAEEPRRIEYRGNQVFSA